MECEPYLTSDHQLMLEKTAEIIIGIKVMMKALNAPKAIIGVENNKTDAIEKLRAAIGSESSIKVEPLKVQYPQVVRNNL